MKTPGAGTGPSGERETPFPLGHLRLCYFSLGATCLPIAKETEHRVPRAPRVPALVLALETVSGGVREIGGMRGSQGFSVLHPQSPPDNPQSAVF